MQGQNIDVAKTVEELQEQITNLKKGETLYQAEIFQKKFDEIAQQLYFLKEEVENMKK
ncbi:MAG TPA: hypothetical protein VK121_08790 [Pseudogracilibacillus sp.]|nr:hypothetical protein [Pseudogracilibacillus sp.]